MPGMAELYPFRVVELRLAISQHFGLGYKERLAAANNGSGCFFGKQSLVQIAVELGINTDGLTKHEVENEIRVTVGESATSAHGLNKQTLMRVILEVGIPVGEKTVSRGSQTTETPKPEAESNNRTEPRCKDCDVQSQAVMPRETGQRTLTLCPACADERRALSDQDMGSVPPATGRTHLS